MSLAHVMIPIFCSSCHMRLLLSPPTCHNILHINWRNHFQHVILYRYDRLKCDNLWHNLVSNTTSIIFKSYVFFIHNWAVENPRQPHVPSLLRPAITTAPKAPPNPRAARLLVGKKMSQSPTALMTDKTIKPVDLVQSPRTPPGSFSVSVVTVTVTVPGFFVSIQYGNIWGGRLW